MDALDRMSELRALAQGAHDLVILKGFHEPGDGGGSFRWDADTTSEDDGGTIIVKATVLAMTETRTGCWKRLAGCRSSPIAGASSVGPLFNVKWFGARGNASTEDDNSDGPAIQAAITACGNAGGGVVLIPPGRYNIRHPLLIQASRVVLQGCGNASVIRVFGFDDALVIRSSPPGSWLSSVQVDDLYFDESAKQRLGTTVGRWLIFAERVANFVSNRLYAGGGFNGLSFYNFNNVTLNHPRIVGYRGGAGTAYVHFAGGRSNIADDLAFASDTARIQQGVFGGFVNEGIKGIDINGRVSNVTLHSCHVVSSGAASLHLQNLIAATSPPTMIVTYDFETDYPRGPSIQIDHGRECSFIGSQLHGAMASDNIYIGPDNGVAKFACRGIQIAGGFVSGAAHHGIAIYGRDVVVDGVRVRASSATEAGHGQYSGMFVGATARGVAIRGCRSGEADSSGFQKHGCEVHAAADHFSIVGNVFSNNAGIGLQNNAGTSPTKVANFNAA